MTKIDGNLGGTEFPKKKSGVQKNNNLYGPKKLNDDELGKKLNGKDKSSSNLKDLFPPAPKGKVWIIDKNADPSKPVLKYKLVDENSKEAKEAQKEAKQLEDMGKPRPYKPVPLDDETKEKYRKYSEI